MTLEPPAGPPASAPSSMPEIENLMASGRTFRPDPGFVAQANATAQLYLDADEDFEAFWAKLARECAQ